MTYFGRAIAVNGVPVGSRERHLHQRGSRAITLRRLSPHDSPPDHYMKEKDEEESGGEHTIDALWAEWHTPWSYYGGSVSVGGRWSDDVGGARDVALDEWQLVQPAFTARPHQGRWMRERPPHHDSKWNFCHCSINMNISDAMHLPQSDDVIGGMPCLSWQTLRQ